MSQKRRRITTEEVLREALWRLSRTELYFAKDLSPLIYEARASQHNPHSTGQFMPSDERFLESQIRPLFEARSWAIKEEQSMKGQSRTETSNTKLPNHSGRGRDLLRQQGLTDLSHSETQLKKGRRLRRIEKGLSCPGISCVLLPVYPKLQRLLRTQETQLIQLLNTGGYPELLEVGYILSPKLGIYQNYYEDN
ncbi:uncharacterized protein BDV17DRAFT_116559 [Aspergillus undulatus]|uniref:uncharacterized protein n=1 Tax=Aspergillus undulatus TaxID=1810928 RepID=UPI003CCCAEFD